MAGKAQIYNMEVAVGLNGSKVADQAKKIGQTVRNIGKQKPVVDMGSSQKSMKDLDKVIAETEKEIDRLQKKQDSLRKKNVNTAQYKEMQKELRQAEQNLRTLEQAAQNLGTKNPRMKLLREQEIEQARAQVQGLKESLASIEQYGATDKEASEMARLEDATASARQRLAELNAEKSGTAAAAPPVTPWEKFKNTLAGVASRARGAGSSITKAFGSGARASVSLLGKALDKFKGKILSSHGALNKMKRGLLMGTGIKGLVRLGLAGAGVYAMIRGMRQGFENLAQYSNPVNNSISSVMSSLATLKNALAAAFAPILNVVAPLISKFVDMMSAAANAVARFFGALTGKGSVAVAKKYATNYAAGLKKAGSSAGKAAKKQKKLNDNLLAFDQINKLQSNKNANAGSGGAGGGGGNGADVGNMFDTVKVGDKFKDLAKMLKDAWAKGDFTALGTMLGEKINKALESIPWGKIKATARKIASSIATFLNGFLRATNWELVGKTLSEGINTALEFLYTAAKKFDWAALGAAIGRFLAGAFKNIDVGLLAKTLSAWAVGILKAVTGFYQSINWFKAGQALVKGLANFLKNMDYGGIVKALIGALGSAIGAGWAFNAGVLSGIAKTLGKAIGGAVDKAKEYFKKKIKEAGGNIPKGIFKGIVDGLKGIGSWIKKNVFEPFIKGFKKAFGIASPAKTMGKPGQEIILGVLKGAKKKLDDLITWFKNLPKKILKALGGALQIGVDFVVDKASSIAEWISGKAGDVGATIEVGLKKASEWSSDAWNALKSGGQTAVSTLQQNVQKGGTWIADAWSAAKKGAGTVARTLQESVQKGTWIKDAWSAAKKTGKTVAKKLKESVEKGTWVKDAWSAAKTTGKTIYKTLQISVSWIGKKLVEAWKVINGKSGSKSSGGGGGGGGHAWATGGLYTGGHWKPVTAAAAGGQFGQGQMFVAREAGPELVGTIGGNTAVMNNDQIVSSVAAGVYKAVVAGMSQADHNTTVVLEGDAGKLFRVMRQQASSFTMATGQPAFPV